MHWPLDQAVRPVAVTPRSFGPMRETMGFDAPGPLRMLSLSFAATPLTVLVLGPREFSGLLDEVPTLTHKILAALAARVRELDTRNYG